MLVRLLLTVKTSILSLYGLAYTSYTQMHPFHRVVPSVSFFHIHNGCAAAPLTIIRAKKTAGSEAEKEEKDLSFVTRQEGNTTWTSGLSSSET